jgi:hypothetical protein
LNAFSVPTIKQKCYLTKNNRRPSPINGFSQTGFRKEWILNLVKETGRGLILQDCLEMETPPVDVPVSQWKLNEQASSIRLRRAVVVPNARLAYLGRLAFGNDDIRVFYNDMAGALAWLTGSDC